MASKYSSMKATLYDWAEKYAIDGVNDSRTWKPKPYAKKS